ncbi:MAG: ABC transporter ATP-binding protein [Anaerolineae bacterium]|nr:ABC transporter ATP-binding protein [Anaerolineae bacterium]
MPTIVLRHITKQYRLSERPEMGTFNRIVSSSTRLFDRQSAALPTPQKQSPEPPNRTYALDNLSLTIRNGETLAILGPSGCGKTTLLRIIAGLLKPDEGEVTWDSVPLRSIPMAERGIGMVFQTYALYPHMPAYDNVGFYDLIRKQPEKIPDRIRKIVKIMGVDLHHLLSRKPPTLSGGEQQRVAIARCLARDPQLFLFDEPLSNLDAKLRTATRIQIKRLLQHYRITSVYVTHDQIEAIAFADRIAIMRKGKIEQAGTFRTLYDAPKNAFIATFFGTPPMNLFPGHIWENTWEGRGFTVTPIRPGLQQGQSVQLGIRPEHITLADDGIAARVEYIEPNFPAQRQMLYLNLAGRTCVASVPINILVERNDPVHLQFPSEHLYFFDGDTGTRIG